MLSIYGELRSSFFRALHNPVRLLSAPLLIFADAFERLIVVFLINKLSAPISFDPTVIVWIIDLIPILYGANSTRSFWWISCHFIV